MRRWLLDDEIVPLEWVEREIDRSEQRFADGGCGLWTVRGRPEADGGGGDGAQAESSPDELVGFVGFRHFWDPPELELVYGLHPSVWGRGVASEAGRAVMAHAFDDLGFVEVLAATDVPNEPSIAVLERLGFQEWRRTDDGPDGTVFFRIVETRWREVVTHRR